MNVISITFNWLTIDVAQSTCPLIMDLYGNLLAVSCCVCLPSKGNGLKYNLSVDVVLYYCNSK